MNELQNYINGKWRAENKTIASSSPLDETHIISVPQSSRETVEDAVQSALKAFVHWNALQIGERIQYLKKFAAILKSDQASKEEIVDSIVFEIGKPRVEAETELIEVVDIINYYSNIAETALAQRNNQIDSGTWPYHESYTVLEPLGVVAIIKPWNYPFSNPLWAIIPALVSGNTIVFKPSEYSSKTGLCIASTFDMVHLPDGVFNTVCGNGEVGKTLVSHNDISFIGFTGSVEVGKEIGRKCIESGKSCSLELGGNDAAIVLSDADIEMAANGVLWGGFTNAGQVCTGTKRVFVHKDISRDFTERIIRKAKALRPNIEIGPVIRHDEATRIIEYVEDAKRVGGIVETGGRIEPGSKSLILPTIITKCNTSMRLFTEEVFGPILPIFTFDSENDVISMVNQDKYGLGASIWSKDVQHAQKVALKLDVGMVWINDVNLPFPQAPWAGRKNSGPGVELSVSGLLKYVREKHVCVDRDINVTRQWWFPYQN